jgi:threonine synthase
MFTLTELEDVIPLVRSSVPPTPQYAWPLLKAQTGVEVVVKHENHTPIGAFKVRGGIVYFDRLKHERPQVQGIVTATRGNHGQSLAFAGARAPGTAIVIAVLRDHFLPIEKRLLKTFVRWCRRVDSDGEPTNPVVLLTSHELLFDHNISATWETLGEPYVKFSK